MLCCLFAALSAGNLAVVARTAGRLAAERTGATVIALAAGLAGLAALSPFAIEHAGHYADRAAAHERSILAEILAQPLCSGKTRASIVATHSNQPATR